MLSDLDHRDTGYGKLGSAEVMEIRSGQSFVFVSGVAGYSMRAYDTAHDTDTWWASYYTSTNWMKNGQMQPSGGTFGAMFIRFNVMGDPRRAWGYVKDVLGRVVDEFNIVLSP